MPKPLHRRARRKTARPRPTLPALGRNGDAQKVRVHALLAPATDVTRWRLALRNGTPSRRASAAVALGARLGGAASVVLAHTLRTDPSAWVRQHAALALVHAASPAATRVVCARLPLEADDDVKATLVRALGRAVGLEQHVEAQLLSHVHHASGSVVAAAVWALHERGHPLTVHAAVGLLSHTDPHARQTGAAVLAAQAPRHQALTDALKDEDRAVVSLASAGVRSDRWPARGRSE